MQQAIKDGFLSSERLAGFKILQKEFKLKSASLSKLLYLDFMIPIKEKDA